jgi:anti-anti-sigma factor
MIRPFKLSESDRRTGCRELSVEGDLDLAVTDELEAALDRADGCAEVWVDLRDCDFLDSTALAIFVNTHVRMEEEGRRIFLYRPTAQVERILTVAGLTQDGLVVAAPRSPAA